jgi:hypothetical protein
MKCFECGEHLTEEDSLGAEVTTKKGQPVWKDVCRSCYDEIVKTCQLCGNPDLMPSDVSRFILVKAELASTADRPPGIYQILSYPFLSIPMLGGGSIMAGDILFIDKLPKPDAHYDISGHICKDCAKPYAIKRKEVYGERKMTDYYKPESWQLQREHVRSTILSNPDMLRDIECDKESHTDWEDLQEKFCLPPELPTYHEWVLLNYGGVKIYKTHQSDKHGDSWLLLRPEPKFRNLAFCGGGDRAKEGGLFCASSLPTFPQEPNDGKYHNPYDWARQHSLPAIRKAIKLGLITQKGTFDAKGKPFTYG